MQETTCLTTLGDWLRWAVSRFHAENLFFGHGTDNAWDEALYLITHTLHLPIDINPVVFNATLTEPEREKLLTILTKRIKNRIPASYLTNHAIFANLEFYIDERTLIPRSSLAELIINEFHPWTKNPPKNILDLCTGSACIAIACAKYFPNSKITAADISEDALQVAKININNHQVNSQIELIRSNLFNKIPSQKFDIIISNPPYVDQKTMQNIPQEYTHEPNIGLEAGKDGLAIVTKILHYAEKYLAPKGILIVEVGNSEVALIEKMPYVPFTWLELNIGDTGVFLLTKEQLQNI